MSQITLVKTLVDNPAWRPDLDGEKAFPRKVEAVKNVRESTISVLASRKDKQGKPLINESQLLAAHMFRQAWEATGGVGAKAIDYSREYVDGGQIADPISQSQVTAAKRLASARDEIGTRMFNMLVLVCGQGLGMMEMFDHKRDRLTATDNLRYALDDLSKLWGLQGSAGSKPRRRYAGNVKEQQRVYMARKDRSTFRKLRKQ